MTGRLKRFQDKGHLHFVTFSCYKRLPLLESAEAKGVLISELETAREEYGFLLVGFVVMPEHVHLLVSEPKKKELSIALQVLKQRVSRKLRSQLESGEKLKRFWQVRYYDFNVYSSEKKIEKLRYMHRNPVERGLVRDPGEWVCSSWGCYAGTGREVIKVDMV